LSRISPWLSVKNAVAAIDYYKKAFGAVELYRLEDDHGGIAVVHLSFGEADFWVQADPEFNADTIAGGSFRLIVTVDNPDVVFEQTLAAGATLVAPISDGYGWRIGRIVDPFGYHWEIGKQLADSM